MTTSRVTRLPAAELVAEGRAALLAGEKARARSLLQIAIRDDPDNVEAWLWLSGTHTQPDEIAYCLRQVLARDPANPQAQEGLTWLAETFDSEQIGREQLAAAAQPVVEPPAPAPLRVDRPVTTAPYAAQSAASGVALIEAGLHVAGVGALLGLLRLTASLRPGTLLLIRGAHGAIDLAASLGLAFGAALLHALALIVAWGLLGRSLSRARNDRRGDHFDSLLRAAHIFVPGYLILPALLLTAAGLGWSERRWMPLILAVWIMLLLSLIACGRRFAALVEAVRVSYDRRALQVARILVPAFLIALLGLGLAGLAVQALLRAL